MAGWIANASTLSMVSVFPSVEPGLATMSLEVLRLLSLVWIGLACLTFLGLLFFRVPYGRYLRRGWGKAINSRQAWIIMELPSLFLMLVLLLSGGPVPYAFFLGALWLLHCLNRSLVYPFRIGGEGQSMPLSLVVSAVGFNLVHAVLNGAWLGHFETCENTDFDSWNFYIGLPLFLAGAFINWHSDGVLIRLRGETGEGYSIPRNGLFRWVSCPNYLGEVIEWAGFALLAWNLPALSMFAWAVANLVPRALQHHRWYQSRFEDYPRERRAILPFIL